MNNPTTQFFIRNLFRVMLFAIASAAFYAPILLAAPGINNQIPFQGLLKNDSGTLLDGSYDMVFRIYDAASGGATLWTGTHTAVNGNPVTVTDGVFRVLLGSGAGNTLNLNFDDDAYYLGLTVEGDAEMTPRQRLGSAPYAFNAERLDGLDSTNFLRTDITNASATITDLLFTNATGSSLTIGSDLITDLTGSGLVVVGNALTASITPAQVSSIDVAGDEECLTYESTSSRFEWQSCAAGGGTVNSGLAGQVAYYAADGTAVTGTSSIFIAANRNVGVGTSSPASLLDVWGDFRVGTSGTSTLFVDTSTGKVTINSDTPNFTLNIPNGEVYSNGYLLRNTGTDIGFNTMFYMTDNSDPNDSYKGHLAGYRLSFDTGNDYARVPRMVISTGGDIGIGTTSPIGKLDVLTGSTGADLNIRFEETASDMQAISFAEGGTNFFRLTHDASGFTPNNLFKIQATDGFDGVFDVDVMTFMQSGNVGIGTTSPASMLDVWGDFRAGTSSMDRPALFVDASTGNVGIGTSSPGTNLQINGTNESVALRILNEASPTQSTYPSVYVTNYKSFGGAGEGGPRFIGELSRGTVTSPAALVANERVLQLIGRGSFGATGQFVNGAAINFESAGTWSAGSYPTRITFDNISDGSMTPQESMRIDEIGRVGIGTTTPEHLLSVAGDMRLTGALFDSNNASGTLGMVLQSTAAGTQWVATNTLGFGTGTGDVTSGLTGQVAYYAADGTAVTSTSSLFIAANGNVGIGTTSPGSKLQVVDSSNQLLLGNGTYNSTFNSGLILSITGARGFVSLKNQVSVTNTLSVGSTQFASDIGSAALYVNGTTGIGTTSPASMLDVWGDFRVGTGSVPALFVDVSTGNVGIGSSSPNAEFSIVSALPGSSSEYIFSAHDSGGQLRTSLSGSGSQNWYLGSSGRIGFGTPSGSPGISIFTGASYDLQRFDMRNASTNFIMGYVIGGADYLSFADSGGIGISTSSPASTLDVWGDFRVGTGSASTLFVDASTGRVGIGTTSPTSVLSVEGIVDATFNSGAGGYISSGNTDFGGSRAYFPQGISTPLASSNYIYGGLTTSGIVRNCCGGWYINPVGDVYFNTSGNFGVGTTTPTNIFTVSTSSSQTAAVLRQYGTGDILNLFDGVAEVLTVLDGGNVGIGTSSPTERLEVFGNIKTFEQGLFGDTRIDSSGIYRNDPANSIYGFGPLTSGGAYPLVMRSGTGSSTSHYTGFSFDTAASGNGSPYDVTGFDGYLWVTDLSDAEVYQYNSDGTYTGFSFDTAASGNTDLLGIAHSGTHFWTVDNTGSNVYQYNSDGTYTGFSFDTAANGASFPAGITYHDGYLWVTENIGAEVYRYTTSGAYTGFSFDTAASGNGNPVGITYFNEYFWIADVSDNEIYQYNSDGTYTGFSFDTAASGNGLTRGIGAQNGYLYTTDGTDTEIYQYTTGTSTGGYLTFETDGNERMHIDANGNVGIGTSTPTAQLTTTGTVRFANFGAGSLETDANGNLSIISDIRLKNIEGGFEPGLVEVLGLEPIVFKWKEETGLDTENFYAGFSAQNVQENIPEAVGEDRRGFLTLSDRPILAAVVNAIKDMWDIVLTNTGRIETVETENAELKERIEVLEAQLGITYTPPPREVGEGDQIEEGTATSGVSGTATPEDTGSTTVTENLEDQNVILIATSSSMQSTSTKTKEIADELESQTDEIVDSGESESVEETEDVPTEEELEVPAASPKAADDKIEEPTEPIPAT